MSIDLSASARNYGYVLCRTTIVCSSEAVPGFALVRCCAAAELDGVSEDRRPKPVILGMLPVRFFFLYMHVMSVRDMQTWIVCGSS